MLSDAIYCGNKKFGDNWGVSFFRKTGKEGEGLTVADNWKRSFCREGDKRERDLL